jgi:DNA-binding LacI/PurR family transcriptional regulator
MADIAKLAGVSPSTVSRALSGQGRILEETRQRIHVIAKEHNYQPNVQAKNFRLKRTQTIAAVIPFSEDGHRQVADPFYLQMVGDIIDELADRGYAFLVSRLRGSDGREYRRYAASNRSDGMIILAREVDDPGIKALEELGIDFVVWGAPLKDQAYVSVGYSGVKGVRQAVNHLSQQGCRRIGFIGGNADVTDTWLRLKGYKLGLEDAGLPFEEDLVATSYFTPETGQKAMRRFLEQIPDLDSVFIASDFMAIAAMDVIHEFGLRVPQDIAVVGYDDIPFAAFCNPPLTTLRQDIYRSSKLLVEKLFQLMEGEPASSVELEEELIIRASSIKAG